MKFGIRVACLASVLAGACSSETAPTDDSLSAGTDFVAIARPATPEITAAQQSFGGGNNGTGSVVIQDGNNNFYLAIKKSSLSQKWFLSAYAKQWFPDDVNAFADATLGTRVVSFKIQNDKLFIFDTSDQFHNSDLSDPTILVEAWPIVHSDSFDHMRHSDDYVLVDPSAGLNRFQVTSSIFSDPRQGSAFSIPFHVGLAFMQGFRQLADGAVFEEVFEGDLNGLENFGLANYAYGTLGITLRKYFEGPGYQMIDAPDVPHFFLSDQRLIPGTEGATVQNPIHFNFHKGMKPIDVIITEGAFRAQADFPDIDLLGAFKRGVETWNDVFGFKVFNAVLVHSDAVPDDDKSFVLIDYPGNSGFAFADWRSNPNTGETRGMSVYFSGAFLQDIPFFDDDPTARAVKAKPMPQVHSLTWGGMPTHKPACVLWAPSYRDRVVGGRKGDSKLTAQQKASAFIQHVIAHEVGHTLGLRHNFEGSLEPPSSSLMDYLDDFTDAIALANPGPYDRQAVRFLYGLSPNLPTNKFCTDEDTQVNPVCQTFDSGADPLYDWWVGNITFLEGLILDNGFPTSFLDTFYLNETLEFARDIGFVPPQERTDAILASLDRTLVPMSAADAADPDVVAQANLYAEAVLRRIVLDPPGARGNIDFDISDPDVINLVASQAGAMLRNEDHVRTLELRRVTVAVLKAMQADAAFLELRSSQTALQAALDAHTVPAADVPFEEDLLSAIDAALSPYFEVN